jgi:diguanylate cyclase (GGDEF)-like protein
VALLLAFLAAVAWNRRREAPEAATFAVLVASMVIYAFGYAGELAQTTIAGAQYWLNVEYLALPWAGGLWVLAACRHNRIKVWVPLLFVIPAITFAGYYTNFHQLFYTAPPTMTHRGHFWVMEVHRGPLSTLDNAYLLVCFLAGSWVYLSAFRHASALYRRQALILVMSSFVPFVGYFVYLGGLSPWGLDITPLTLGVTCGLLHYGIFRSGVFDLAPLARTLIFNSMRDAVLILDPRDRLLDFNPVAIQVLPILSREAVGAEIQTLLGGNADLLRAITSGENPAELKLANRHVGNQAGIASQGVVATYEVRTWPLYSDSMAFGRGRQGRAVIFADVTAQVQLREELRHQSETDALTGIANRRRFHQALEIECIRFTRGHAPLSVLMIDLDFFKEVNDQYGHPVGDAVLRAISQRLSNCLRKTDLLARYGGEEFAVLLPETRGEGASIIAERIRTAMNLEPMEIEGLKIPVSVSVGVASHTSDKEVDPAILLKKADLALYRAKAAGRNRVEVA